MNRLCALLLWASLTAGAAAAPCDPAAATLRSAALRAQLDGEAHRARVWDVSWTLIFAAAAGGQVGLALGHWNPLGRFDHDVRAADYVNASKAGLGALSHLILPLRVTRPGPAGPDACADLAAAEAALHRTADGERRAFWLNHLGGLAVQLGGLFYLGLVQHSWKQGVISFALGYPVGLLSIYTQPRASWHAARSEPPATLQVTATQAPGFTGLGLAYLF